MTFTEWLAATYPQVDYFGPEWLLMEAAWNAAEASQNAGPLEDELEAIAAKAVALGKAQAEEWDRFWKAIDCHSDDISVDDAIEKWKGVEAENERLMGIAEGKVEETLSFKVIHGEVDDDGRWHIHAEFTCEWFQNYIAEMCLTLLEGVGAKNFLAWGIGTEPVRAEPGDEASLQVHEYDIIVQKKTPGSEYYAEQLRRLNRELDEARAALAKARGGEGS